jgi:hypothetical protein
MAVHLLTIKCTMAVQFWYSLSTDSVQTMYRQHEEGIEILQKVT